MKHGLAALFSLLVSWVSLTAEASIVEVKHSITSPTGGIAGFTTEDPHLVYMVPTSWELYQNNIYQDGNKFFFILAPSYDHQTLAQYKLNHPDQAMIPIPHRLNEASLFLGESLADEFALGTICYEVTPDNLSNQSDLIYYNLDVAPEALPGFLMLLKSNLGINGFVEMSYPFNHHIVSGQIPLFVQAKTIKINRPSNYSVLWLQRIAEIQPCLDLAVFINGSISLGFQRVTVESNNSRACWIPGNLLLQDLGQNQFTMKSLSPTLPDLQVKSKLFVPELGLHISLSVSLAIEAKLDVLDIAVTIPEMKIIKVEIEGQGLNTIYKTLLKNLVAQHAAAIRAEIGRQLTEELRLRIINGNLFE